MFKFKFFFLCAGLGLKSYLHFWNFLHVCYDFFSGISQLTYRFEMKEDKRVNFICSTCRHEKTSASVDAGAQFDSIKLDDAMD
jgi:hypothetical protein